MEISSSSYFDAFTLFNVQSFDKLSCNRGQPHVLISQRMLFDNPTLLILACLKTEILLFVQWAKLPKSGKLEKSKKSHNFLKIVGIIVDFFSHIVKFDFGWRNNFWGFVPSFILFKKIILCFWDNFVKKKRSKSVQFQNHFKKKSIFSS